MKNCVDVFRSNRIRIQLNKILRTDSNYFVVIQIDLHATLQNCAKFKKITVVLDIVSSI